MKWLILGTTRSETIQGKPGSILECQKVKTLIAVEKTTAITKGGKKGNDQSASKGHKTKSKELPMAKLEKVEQQSK